MGEGNDREFVVAMKSPLRGFGRVVLTVLVIGVTIVMATLMLVPLWWLLAGAVGLVALTLIVWLVMLPFAWRVVRHPTRVNPTGLVLGAVGLRVAELPVPWSAIDRIWVGTYQGFAATAHPSGSLSERFHRRFPHTALFIRVTDPASVADGRILKAMRTSAGHFDGAHFHLGLALAKVSPDEIAAAVHRHSGGRVTLDLTEVPR